MAEVTYQYWQHARSGEVYAVELVDNSLSRVCGPLHHTEITTDNLPDFEYDAEDIDWVRDNPQDFRLKEVSTSRYAALDNDTFDALLAEILDGMTGAAILQIPGVYDVVAEEFNNDVLDLWEERRQETSR